MNTFKAIAIPFLLFTLNMPASAHDIDESEKATLSKAEEFEKNNKNGLIVGFVKIGSVEGEGSIELSVFEHRLASNDRKRMYALHFSFSGAGNSKASSVIDDDEIQSVIRDLKRMKESDFRVGSGLASPFYRASFKTNSGLTVSADQYAGSPPSKEFTFSVFPDRKVRVKIKSSDIDKLIELLTKAETVIKEARAK